MESATENLVPVETRLANVLIFSDRLEPVLRDRLKNLIGETNISLNEDSARLITALQNAEPDDLLVLDITPKNKGEVLGLYHIARASNVVENLQIIVVPRKFEVRDVFRDIAKKDEKLSVILSISELADAISDILNPEDQ